MLPKKFELPVQAAIGRRYGWRTTYASPSLSSGSIFDLTAPSARAGSFSAARMGITNAVEIAKLIASRTIAYGAVSALINAPAMLGPATVAVDAVICSFELPSTRASRSTRDGRYDWYATSKNTVKIPTRNWITSRCHI